MKALIIVGLMAAAMPVLHAEDTQQEKDFKARFESAMKSGDMQQMTNICVGSPLTSPMELLDYSSLELCFWRGVKSVKFEPVYPVIQDTIKKGVNIDGARFVPNLEPYKMLAVVYEKRMKNESAGFSILTGIKDGKIMITGYKVSDK
ncbi:MAG: hypothetical protein WCK57_13605 [Verrucomicrobiae bacterium]